ncbi:MAG: Ig-like domain-containing protein [Myxococcota bacterium]
MASLFGVAACSTPDEPTAGYSRQELAVAVQPERPESDAALRAHRELRRWLERFLSGSDKERHEMAAEGERLAAARRPLMRALLLQEPELALSMAFNPLERAQLPESIATHLEAWRDGRGTLHVIGALGDERTDDATSTIERFVTFDDERSVLRTGVFGKRLGELTRSNIRLHGVALDGVIAVTDSRLRRLFPGEPRTLPIDFPRPCPVSRRAAEPENLFHGGDVLYAFCNPLHADAWDGTLAAGEEAAAVDEGLPPASSWTEGPKTVLFIRVDFSDRAGDPLSSSAAQTLIDTTVNDFFVANSYGKTSLSATVTPTLRLPKTRAEYQAGEQYLLLRSDALAAATTAGYVLGNYNLDIIAFASTFSGWAGRGYVGSKGAWLNGTFNQSVTAHELGHNYGVFHANAWNTSNLSVIGPGTNQEYGNPFDVMGASGGSTRHFNAWFKRRFDWIASAETGVATASGTFRVFALESAISSGLHGLKVPRDSSKDYWVEFRPAFSNDALQNGASINWGYPTNAASHLLDMTPGDNDRNDSPLRIGRTFSDALAGIHITPVGKGGTTPESLDVVVNRGTFPANGAPVLTLSASDSTPSSGASVTLTATASDPDGDSLAYFWEYDDNTFGPNAATVTKSWSAQRVYNVRCTVSDMKGQRTSASVALTVGTPANFTLAGTVLEGSAPLEGVRVTDGTRETFTTSDGRYLLTNVPAGNFTVNAAKLDYTFTRSFAAPLAVSGNQTMLDFTATRVAGYSVQGRVTVGVVGRSGVTVSDGVRTATTNASGDYTLTGVPTGRHTLSATAPGWQFIASFVNPLDVIGGNVTGMNFYAAGQVLSGALPGSVTTAPVVTDGVRTVTAMRQGANWTYFLSLVPNGSWNLVATSPGVTLTPQNFTNPITVSSQSKNNLNFDVAMTTTYLVQGTVRTGGTPLPGVTVSDGARGATTDSLGRYTLVGVPPGTYTLTPVLAGYTFVPATLSVTVTNADLTNNDFSTTVVNLPPTVVTAAAASPSPVASGTTTQLSALGADDGGEASLTYSWSAAGAASLYPVLFSGNGTNGAKNITATFSGAGSYTFECVIQDPGGLSVRTSTTVLVQQAASALTVTPAMANVITGLTQQFTAQLRDQFGRAMFAGSPTWLVSGGGTISTTGLFTAGPTPGGPHTVNASVAGRNASALVQVSGLGAPTITSAASANPSPVVGITTALSVRATDDAGEAGLVYRWTSPLGPAPVTFSVNDANAAKDTTATFTTAGDYQFLVTVADGAGNTVTSMVAVEVQATPTRIELQPTVVSLQVGNTQRFTATVQDQFNAPLAAQPTLIWSVAGGGVVDATGLFTAGATAGGPFNLTVSGAGLTATAQITIGNAPDTESPAVQLTSPVANARPQGVFRIAATATDNVGVVLVELFADAQKLGEMSTAPFELMVDAATLTVGPHTLTARASDAAGNTAISDGVPILIESAPIDTSPPTVRLTSPTEGETTGLMLWLTAEASDDVDVTQVQLEVDGAVVAELSAAPWTHPLEVGAGEHSVVAIAFDAAGHFTRSEAVRFTASEEVVPPSGPPEEVVGSCGCSGPGDVPFVFGVLLLALAARAGLMLGRAR